MQSEKFIIELEPIDLEAIENGLSGQDLVDWVSTKAPNRTRTDIKLVYDTVGNMFSEGI